MTLKIECINATGEECPPECSLFPFMSKGFEKAEEVYNNSFMGILTNALISNGIQIDAPSLKNLSPEGQATFIAAMRDLLGKRTEECIKRENPPPLD